MKRASEQKKENTEEKVGSFGKSFAVNLHALFLSFSAVSYRLWPIPTASHLFFSKATLRGDE